MKLFKLIDRAYRHDVKIDTRFINYGAGIEYRLPRNKELITFFNAVINDSLRYSIPFNDIFRETYQPQTGNQAVLFWETLYERAREADFSWKPSRLDSYFAFSSVADAERFKQRSHSSHMLKVFETQSSNVVHIGDMEHLDQIVPEMTAIEALAKAALYWQGSASERPLQEYLVQGKLSLLDIS